MKYEDVSFSVLGIINDVTEKVVYEYDRDKIFKKEVMSSIVDKENSYMIGDKWLDVLAGERYGVNAVFVMSGEGYVEYHHKKESQKTLPQKYEIYGDINEFIKEKL